MNRMFSSRNFTQSKWYLGLLSILILSLNSCGGGSEGVSQAHVQIPADVAFAMSMDVKSMSSKAKNWKELMNEDFYETMEAEEAREVFDKVLESGIDLTAKVYMFGDVQPDDEKGYFAVSFLIKDAKAFEKALSESKKKPEIKSQDKIKYIQEDEVIIGWEGNKGLIMADFSSMMQSDEKEIMKRFMSTFNTKAENSLSSKEKLFTQVNGAGYDISFWVNQQKLNDLNKDAMSELTEMSPVLAELSKVNLYSTGGINFENGEIVFEATSHLDPKKSAEYEAILKAGVKDELVNLIPIKDPSSLMGFALSMPDLYEFLKDEPFMEEMKLTLKAADLTPKDIFEMLDGDMVMVTKDLKTETLLRNPQPEMAIGIGIANKKTLDKIMEEAELVGAVEKRKDYYAVQGAKLFIVEKDDAVYFTMTDSFKDDLVKGNGKIAAKYKTMAGDKTFAFYMNIPNIMNQIPDMVDDDSKEITDKFDSMTMESQPVSNHKVEGMMTLKFKDKNKNALEILAEIAKISQKSGKALSLK